MIKNKIFLILVLILFCKVNSVYQQPINQFSFSLKVKIFFWDHYYKNQWENLLYRMSQQIIEQVPDHIQIGQVIHTGLSGTTLNPTIEQQLKEFCFGGIILFKANVVDKNGLISLIQDFQKKSLEYCKIPLFFSIDQEGGRVVRLTDFVTEFPSAMAIGETKNPNYAWFSGFITGYELSSLGIPLIFAPVADINNNPENPVIHTRSFGTTKEVVSTMVRSYIEGINRSLAIGFLKHFPGHGDTNIDSHLNLPIISKTIQELEELEMIPFKEGIRVGAKGVMVAHILFPALDEYPATLSKTIITGILKETLKFNGLVITDAMEMRAVSDRFSLEKASYISILAGADIILLTAQNENINKIYKYLKKSIKENPNLKERIYESVKKQIYFKLDSGVFNEEILRDFYKIHPDDLELYKRLLKIKIEISHEIYQEIFQKHADLSYQIAYDSIRSLYKDFPKLELLENTYSFYLQSKIFFDEVEIMKFNHFKNEMSQIHIYPKNEFLKSKNVFDPNEIILIEIEHLEEWEKLSKLQIPYKRLIGLYSGNPFKTIKLKENQYIIASFSPTKQSLRSMIHKIFKENIPKSNLDLSSKDSQN